MGAEKFVQSLLQTVVSKEIDLIISVTEPMIQPIVRYRDLFDEATRVALPKNEMLKIVTNKAAALALATSLGVPIPTTFIAHSAPEALLLAKELLWPIVVKPISSATLTAGNVVEKQEVKYAGSQAQLKDIHQGLGYGVELLLFEGEPLVAFAHKRL